MALIALNPAEARTAAALFERMFPADEGGPGATAIGVVDYLDRALAGEYAEWAETYRVGLAALDRIAREEHGAALADCAAADQDDLIERLERQELAGLRVPGQREFFDLLRAHLQEGLFADPAYGGNRDKRGWRLLGHTGVWFENSAEENLAADPVTKGGEIRSLEDLGRALGDRAREPEDIPGYDPQRGA